MADQKLAEPTVETLDKTLQEFIIKYQVDIETLNRILSSYEDKLALVEKQFYDVSFRLKQIQNALTSQVETKN